MDFDNITINNNKTKLNTYLVLFFIFSFPLIILLNYILDIRSGLLSYCFRGLVLLFSFGILYTACIKNLSFKPTFIYLGLFWVFYIFRLILDLEYYDICKNNVHQKIYFYFYAVFVNFIPMVAIAFIKPIDLNLLATRLRQLLKIFVFIILVLVIQDYLGNHGFLRTGRLWLRRGEFEFLNPVTIGFYSAVLVILIIYKKNRKLLDLFFLLLSFLIIGLTASRGPTIFLVFIIVLILFFKRSLIFKSLWDYIIYCSIFVISIIVFFSYNSNLINRLHSSDQSNNIRLSIFDKAYSQFSNNPITGTHFLVLPNNYTHNLFIDILVSMGVIGLIIFLPSLIYFIRKIINNKMETAIFTIALLFFLTTQTTGAIFNYNEFWLLFSLIIANNSVEST